MDSLWAPWRGEYVQKAMSGEYKEQGCILCAAPNKEDLKKALVLYKGQYNYVVMNLYPYNLGHVMVVPYRHINAIDLLNEKERNEHYMLVTCAVVVLRAQYQCQGFNIGMNMGRSGGAGIEEHIHTHVVPRWNGDANFMPVIADTKVISETLFGAYDALKKRFDEYK